MTFRHRQLVLLLPALLCGCLHGNARNDLVGSGVDIDRHSRRLEVRPLDASAGVGKQVVLLATVYGDDNKPRSKRRVEWTIEGPGVIYAVDEGGVLQGRGFKEDSKSAVSYTHNQEGELPKALDNPLGQVVRPGQTWCVISSAVEGQTVVHAYAPEIADPDNNRVMVKVNWLDAQWQFPEPSTARAGTELVLQTRVARRTDKLAAGNYRVRYFLLKDGPPATLVSRNGAERQTTTEAVVPLDQDGLAKISIAELKPDFGTNRVGIEIIRTDPNQPTISTVIAKSETKVDWQAPQVQLKVDAPKSTQVNQAFTVTYSVSSTGTLETLPMVLKTAVPPGVELVSTMPKATADGNELLWSLPALPGGKQHTVQAIYKPTATGLVNVAGAVRTNDDLRAEGAATAQVIEARLELGLNVPRAALVGEKINGEITLKNTGSGVATNVRVSAPMDSGLEVVGKPGLYEVVIDKLDAGQSQTLALPLSPKAPGQLTVRAMVKADGNVAAEVPATAIDVQRPEIKLEAYTAPRGYLNQEVTWTLRVFNPSEVTVADVVVRAALPPGFEFRRATENGRPTNGGVEWNLGTTSRKQWIDLQLTAVPTKLGTGTLTAGVVGSPLAKQGEEFKPVSMVKPFGTPKVESPVEILGVPALQLEVFDSADPVQTGQTVTYTIRVKNAGTLQSNAVEISAELPPQFKPLRTFGITNGRIEGQRVMFPAIDSVRPGQTSVLTIEAQAIGEGDGRFRAEVKSLSLNQPLRAEESTRVLPRNGR